MPIVTDGLIGYWNSKQGISGTTWGNIAPATLGQYDTNMIGTIVQPEGVYVDGIDDYIAFPTSESIITDFTIEFMLKSSSSDFTSSIDLSLYIEGYGDGAGYLVGSIGDVGGNTFHRSKSVDHILGTGNVGFALIYTSSDGTLKCLYPDGTTVTEISGTYLRVNSIIYKSKSFINAVRYYNRALTPQETQQNYTVGAEVGLTVIAPEITNELFTSGTLSSSTSSWTSIFSTYYEDNRSEILILKSDLISANFQADDVLKDIRFYISGIPDIDLKNIKIGIKHTIKIINPTDYFEPYDTYTEIFNQPIILKTSLSIGWHIFAFSKDFIWNGIDNVIITLLRDDEQFGLQDSGKWEIRNITNANRYRAMNMDKGVSPFDSQKGFQRLDEIPAMRITVADRVGIESPPIVTTISTNKTKISNEPNINQSIITVQFDTDVVQYVARLNGVDQNTGTLVHTGGPVAANTDAQIIVDWNELATEGSNRINIYGKNASEQWTTYNS